MRPLFSTGSLPCWDFPIRPAQSWTDVDKLRGVYHAPLTLTLSPGDAVPGYPGMRIMDLEPINTGGHFKYTIQAEGSLDNSSPTKVISRGSRRTLESGFDERTVRYITWHADALGITGVASTDVITCTAHGFSNGQRVILPALTGGAGLVGNSVTANGTVYFIISATSNTFQLSTTSGGSAVNFTTDISAGFVQAAEFVLGSQHPTLPYMFAVDVSVQDDNTTWKTVDVTYRGLEWVKPYKRTINGAVTTSDSKFDGYTLLTGNIYTGYPPTDSGSDATLSGTSIKIEYDASTLSLTDVMIWVGTPPTDKIGQFWTPPNPPDVTYFSLSGVSYKYFFPFGWKCPAMPCEQIPGTNIWLISPTFVYQVPLIPVS